MDATGLRFRARTIQAGVWLSVSCCASALFYYLLTWNRPDRPLATVLVGATLVGSLVLTRLRLDELLRDHRREPFFLAWSFTVICMIVLLASFDGGDQSPFTTALFLPLAFAALTYPLRSMLAVGAMVIAGYLVVALGGGEHDLGRIAFWVCSLANATWMCAWQARNHDRHHAEITRISRADPLTGCLNRRGFEERLESELAEAARSGLPVGLILLDLDDFKQTNDEQGHAAGDDVLRWTVATTMLALRPMDALGRIGGDEFAILAPGASAEEAAEVGKRVRAALADRSPASFGSASFPANGIDADELYQHADVQLYAMKRARKQGAGTAAGHALDWAAALAEAVNVRMDARHDHSHQVGHYAEMIARRLGWDDERIGRLRLAAVLHDVGKVDVPDAILRKPGELTPEEVAIMRRHSEVGARIVARVEGMEDVAGWIQCLHEHLDGSGYPAGMAGAAIPAESRLLLVADAYDAMRSHRPYRSPIGHEPALAELRRCAGTQFDPEMVEHLTRALDEQLASGPTTAAPAS
jgi:diguanylate cyclase (GGDEF)-like protein/putative nucleotidyltransferase with HDIG domain